MNKSKFLRIVIGALAVVVAAFIFLNRSSEPEIPTAPEEVVENILKESAPESTRPAKLSTLDFELIEIPDDAAPEVSEEAGVEEPQPKKAAGVKVSGDQVLVVINGQPLTANRLMLPSSFKNGKSLSMPAATLQEVLERSVSRELLLLEAGVQGVELGDRQVTQLEETYRHLTGNPLVLPEGQDVLNLGVTDDAIFHVRDKASRLLQIEFLTMEGEQDTAEARLALRDRLLNAADVEMVETAPPDDFIPAE